MQPEIDERALVFECAGSPQVGIFHPAATTPARYGVVIVVGGGPQYRVGGHRQLVLWARKLAAEGFPVLRFDYRGMGDSHGKFAGFEDIDEDIRSAIDRFCVEAPGVGKVVLWGECDASAAILFYAYRDPRVAGVVLLNPWVRTESGQAKAVLRHYYLQRLMQPSFWRKVVSLRFNPLASIGSALKLLAKTRTPGSVERAAAAALPIDALPRSMPLPDKLLAGINRFKGPIMLVMSGRDLIAREFDDLVRDSEQWAGVMAASLMTRHDIADGDHTFSSAAQRDQVISHGLAWLRHISHD